MLPIMHCALFSAPGAIGLDRFIVPEIEIFFFEKNLGTQCSRLGASRTHDPSGTRPALLEPKQSINDQAIADRCYQDHDPIMIR